MKKLIPVLSMLILPTTAMASDNMAACEAVMVEQVMEDGEPTGAVMQTFAPAVDVLASIYNDEEDLVTEIDGRKVKAILCQRSSVIPTLRDFPILKTGIPFALSTDFESVDSRSVTIFHKDGEFQHVFKGAELSAEQEAELKDAMEVFNLQPHDLTSEKSAKETHDEPTDDMETTNVQKDTEIEVSEDDNPKNIEDENIEDDVMSDNVDTIETIATEVIEDEGLDMEIAPVEDIADLVDVLETENTVETTDILEIESAIEIEEASEIDEAFEIDSIETDETETIIPESSED